MNQKLTTFQMIVFSILIVAIVAAVIVFAAQRRSSRQKAVPITMWGTIDSEIIQHIQTSVNDEVKDSIDITYTEFVEEEYESSLIEALASGEAPDVAILSDDLLLKHENKLFLINYEFYSQLQFKNNFIEAGEFLLREDGVLGFPLIVDPLVLYWNRTILNNEGVSKPPQHWDQFLDLVPKLVVKDSTSNITRSAVAMGEFRNIKNAKEVLIALIQQAGNDVIIRNSEKKIYESILKQRLGYTLRPADTAVNFFIQFSNPSKKVYSWNRALPSSDSMFISGDLAFYFGFASERKKMIEKNPNLNFDITVLPQSRSSDENSTVGKVHFVSILNQSKKIAAAYDALLKITKPQSTVYMSEVTGLPSVRREVLAEVPESAYQDVYNDSALIAKVFLDPNESATQNIFQSLIESVVTGVEETSTAVSRADQEINALFR